MSRVYKNISITPRGTLTLLLLAITINYVDRQTLSVLAPTLRQELRISSLQYSYIINSFLVVYAVMYVVAGRIVDVMGTRRGLGLAVTWWSVAEIMHGFANGALFLCVARAFLAVGEAAIIPSAVKAVAEWFSPKQRSMAIGIAETGLSLGPIIAPPGVVWITLGQGWRYTFFWTGLAGLLWTIPWWCFYQKPSETSLQEDERPRSTQNATRWSELLRSRGVWAVGFGRFFADPVWYFYLFWLPKYLNETRGLSLESIGAFAWIPYAASLLGGLVGGAASSRMIRRGVAPLAARKRLLLLSGGFVSAGVLCVHLHHVFGVLFVISIASFAMLSWGVNLDTLPTDLFPPQQIAQVVGLGGFMGALGGIAFTALTGFVVQYFSYTPIWIASAMMYPFGYLIVSALLRPETGSPPNQSFQGERESTMQGQGVV